MTDQERKVMEMALEALNQATGMCAERTSTRKDVDEAIEALHQALAQPEPWDTSDMAYRPNGLSVEQEPYCWVQSKLVQGTFYKEKPRRIHTIPLYTAPPSKPWVSLTDEEIENISNQIERSDFFDCVIPFARAIEAKLKEKNT